MQTHRTLAIAALGTTALFIIFWPVILLIRANTCGCCILDPWNVIEYQPPDDILSNLPTSPWKGLVFFPGHGEESGRRTDILRASIAAYNPRKWDCIVFYYGADPPSDGFRQSILPCVLVHKAGLAYGDWMLRVTPDMVERAGYTHITVHINDVQYRKGLDPASIVAEMQAQELEVASPNVVGSYWPSMCNKAAPAVIFGMPGHLSQQGKLVRPLLGANGGWLVRFIEIQVTTFTARAWSCWWEMLNPVANPVGYDYDLCFFRFCMAPRMAVLGDGFTAVHWGMYPSVMGGVPSTNNPLGKPWNHTTSVAYREWLVEKWERRQGMGNDTLHEGTADLSSWMCMD